MRLIVYATVNNGLFRNLAVTRITFVSFTQGSHFNFCHGSRHTVHAALSTVQSAALVGTPYISTSIFQTNELFFFIL